jgi:hypothetical protein
MTRRPMTTADRSETTATAQPGAAGLDYDLAPGLGAIDELDGVGPDDAGEVTIGIVPHRTRPPRPRRPKAPRVRTARAGGHGGLGAPPEPTDAGVDQ